MRKWLLLLNLVCWISSGHAGDLGMAGALSGAGQGLGNALATEQALEGQRQLMEQQHRQEMERTDRQGQHPLQSAYNEFVALERAQLTAEEDALRRQERAYQAEADPQKKQVLLDQFKQMIVTYKQHAGEANERVEKYKRRVEALLSR